ncbi:MAG TPA: ATP-binding protein [Candidatus Binatia bacterium]|nr:ATP-binding protein [Candidatus Binatia bacterium]
MGGAVTRCATWLASFLPSFRARLLVLIFFIVIPALGIALYGNLAQRRIEKARVREGASAISKLAASKQEDFIKNAQQLLATLTQFPFLLLATNQSLAETHLSNLGRLLPDYATFGLIETNGMAFCNANPTSVPMYLGDRSYFRRVLQTGRFSIGDFQIGRLSGQRVVDFGYPVIDEQGKLRRVLFASLKLSRLSEAIAAIQVPAGGAVTVMDQSGNVLARTPDPEKWVGTSLRDVPAVRKILAGKGGVLEMKDADKVPRLYAVTTLTNGQTPSLFVSVDVPLTVLFAQADEALFRNFIALGVVAFAMWLVVGFYAKHFFLQPVNALAAAANRLAAGDLSARSAGMQGSLELIQLGCALNQMAESVEERTAQLVETNQALRHEIAERQRAEKEIQEQEREKEKLEQQFLRSQRMESIGALAGGIAHDLNNALVPVLMGSQMLRENGEDRTERGKLLDLITSSGQRCSEMVKQILSFARGTRGQIGSVPLRHLIAEMAKIAKDTFPKVITVHCRAEKDLWNVEGDSTELHQVLMNLCVNARDAMPAGGQLTLTAKNLTLSAADQVAHPDSHPGPCVLLTVADTGTGIPPEVRARIFEPFFTTKAPDRGTGLGLSTVVNLVKRHKGFIELQTQVGKGTEFKIFLPAIPSTESSSPEPKETPLPVGHGEIILLADDEQMVLELAKTTLENYGYTVLVAANGLEALARFEAHKDKISLLVCDCDMPLLDGMSAIRAIRKLAPNLPVILASATKNETEQVSRTDLPHIARLSKPYGIEQLLNGVAKALMDSRPPLVGEKNPILPIPLIPTPPLSQNEHILPG